MKHLFQRKAGIGFVLVCGLMFATALSLIWVPTAHAVLPPRPPVTTPDSESDGAAPAPQPANGQIHLYVQPAQARYWTVVQWQDSGGSWRDVNGWKADVADGHIMWWVAEKDFGTGPFRWAVYQDGGADIDREGDALLHLEEKALLAASEPFYLPDEFRSEAIYVSVAESQAGVSADPIQGQPGGGYGNQRQVNHYQQTYCPQPQRTYRPHQVQQTYCPQPQRGYRPRYQPYRRNQFGR